MRHRARTALFSGDDELAFELSEMSMLHGFGAEGMFLPAYAAHGNHAVVLALLSAYYAARDLRPLIDYQYRAIVDPDFDFDAEEKELRTVYKAATGQELHWGPGGVLSPMAFGTIDLAEADSTWGNQYWWWPYPSWFYGSTQQKRLIIGIGLPDYWREHGFPSHCRPVGEADFECARPPSAAGDRRKMPVGAPN
jgi:hypothetical protein